MKLSDLLNIIKELGRNFLSLNYYTKFNNNNKKFLMI
jgi:hypothetical protein